MSAPSSSIALLSSGPQAADVVLPPALNGPAQRRRAASAYATWLRGLSPTQLSLHEAGLLQPPSTRAAPGLAGPAPPLTTAGDAIDIDAVSSGNPTLSLDGGACEQVATDASEPAPRPADRSVGDLSGVEGSLALLPETSSLASPPLSLRQSGVDEGDDESGPRRRPPALPASVRTDPTPPPEPPSTLSSGAASSGTGLASSSTASITGLTEVPSAPLSAEQQMIKDLVVKDGVSLFFTGSAGTGKSHLLREIIVALRIKYGQGAAVAVTAATGIAALQVGGSTVHSFAGIGLGRKKVPALLSKIGRWSNAAKRWREVKVWIIDEISMIKGDLLDKLSEIGSRLRKDDRLPNDNERPFGGIQMVFCGDFLQLPPVFDSDHRGPKLYAYQAKCWPKVVTRQIELTEVFRQRDPALVASLNEVRRGQLSAQTIDLLDSRFEPIPYDDGIEPMELFATKAKAHAANKARLDALATEGWTYEARDYAHPYCRLSHEQQRRKFEEMIAPASVTLKVGAQVMLICNLNAKLVNGSLGIVIGFSKGDPVVRFSQPYGRFVAMQMHRHDFGVQDYDGLPTLGRIQVPLILAWAITIHKSQGQTLQRVRCDLDRIFAPGQAYVALSRATSLETMQIVNLVPGKIRCDESVKAWCDANLEHLQLPANPSDGSPPPTP